MSHEYCRALLRGVREEVDKNVSLQIRKASWGYISDCFSQGNLEFHINKCNDCPEGFYWDGTGCCVYYARAEGWMSYMDKIGIAYHREEK